ncbi:hypothetical protein LZ31DRAFT_558718 [Colletotrichum somersetense]|nr:hypothetical protein LZ31DRAFT_558718 [Colletotrichum somersetense]
MGFWGFGYFKESHSWATDAHASSVFFSFSSYMGGLSWDLAAWAQMGGGNLHRKKE